MGSKRLIRALIAGAVLAVLCIGLFWLLYYVVLANTPAAVRLFGALLIPPLLLAFGLGAYYALTRKPKP